jgi:hypothetical protein
MNLAVSNGDSSLGSGYYTYFNYYYGTYSYKPAGPKGGVWWAYLLGISGFIFMIFCLCCCTACCCNVPLNMICRAFFCCKCGDVKKYKIDKKNPFASKVDKHHPQIDESSKNMNSPNDQKVNVG